MSSGKIFTRIRSFEMKLLTDRHKDRQSRQTDKQTDKHRWNVTSLALMSIIDWTQDSMAIVNVWADRECDRVRIALWLHAVGPVSHCGRPSLQASNQQRTVDRRGVHPPPRHQDLQWKEMWQRLDRISLHAELLTCGTEQSSSFYQFYQLICI